MTTQVMMTLITNQTMMMNPFRSQWTGLNKKLKALQIHFLNSQLKMYPLRYELNQVSMVHPHFQEMARRKFAMNCQVFNNLATSKDKIRMARKIFLSSKFQTSVFKFPAALIKQALELDRINISSPSK